MKKALFLAFLSIFVLNCATDTEPSNYIKPTNKGIKSVTAYIQDQVKLKEYIEAKRKALNDYSSDEEDLLRFDHSEEYENTYVYVDISKENWEKIINELKKPKKKKGIFSFTRNPLGLLWSIKIVYENNKETKLVLFKINYYDINGDWYHYGYKGGPNFGVIEEIIKKERSRETQISAPVFIYPDRIGKTMVQGFYSTRFAML